jgi:hypothetical protein
MTPGRCGVPAPVTEADAVRPAGVRMAARRATAATVAVRYAGAAATTCGTGVLPFTAFGVRDRWLVSVRREPRRATVVRA